MKELQYLTKTRFYALLGVSFATGERYLARQVINPAAFVDGDSPLFDHSKQAVEVAHKAIANYRAKLRLTRFNLTKN
jgi:hypothetical protein